MPTDRSVPDVLAFVPFLGYGGAETQLALLLSKSLGVDFRFASFVDESGPLSWQFPSIFLGKCSVDGMVELLNHLTPRTVLFHHDGRPAQAVHKARHKPERVVWARHTTDGVDLLGGRWDEDITHIVSASKSIALGDRRERVIYNGVYRPATGFPIPVEHGLPRPVFGCVSRMDGGKHLELVIEAVAAMDSGSCLLVGGGPDERRLDDLAAFLGLSASARYARISPTSEVLPWYASMDLCVLPTEKEGGIPMTLLEASAVGVPCAITSVSDVTEFFTNGRSAFILDEPTLTSVYRVLSRTGMSTLRSVGLAAKDVVARHFSVTTMANAYFEVLGCHRSSP